MQSWNKIYISLEDGFFSIKNILFFLRVIQLFSLEKRHQLLKCQIFLNIELKVSSRGHKVSTSTLHEPFEKDNWWGEDIDHVLMSTLRPPPPPGIRFVLLCPCEYRNSYFCPLWPTVSCSFFSCKFNYTHQNRPQTTLFAAAF